MLAAPVTVRAPDRIGRGGQPEGAGGKGGGNSKSESDFTSPRTGASDWGRTRSPASARDNLKPRSHEAPCLNIRVSGNDRASLIFLLVLRANRSGPVGRAADGGSAATGPTAAHQSPGPPRPVAPREWLHALLPDRGQHPPRRPDRFARSPRGNMSEAREYEKGPLAPAAAPGHHAPAEREGI